MNCRHLKYLYILTHIDDKETINLCMKYDNVRIYYFDFYNNKKILISLED